MLYDEDLELFHKFYNDVVEYFPQLEDDIIIATCRQAVEEGIEDSDIVWEWLQDEINGGTI